MLAHVSLSYISAPYARVHAGTLLGASFFLLIPESAEIVGMGLEGSGCVLAGIMASYMIELALSFRKNYHGHVHGGGMPQDAQDAVDAVQKDGTSHISGSFLSLKDVAFSLI